MDKLRIGSLNVQGLNNDMKCKKTFKYLKQHKLDICMLQETHCMPKMEHVWSSQWGNKCVYSNGTSNARGVMILLSKKCANCIREICRDMEGRFIVIKLQINDITICSVNIYAPNYDSLDFIDLCIDLDYIYGR